MTTVELKQDSTKNIARRYGHLFRLPSTRLSLLLCSLPIIAVELIARSLVGESPARILLYAVATEIALVVGIEIDLLILKARSGLATFRRLSTVSIFSNLLWLAASVAGLFLYLATKSEGRLFSLVLLGAFFAICFRAIVFGSIFYENQIRGLLPAVLQPAILLVPAALSTRAVSAYSLNTGIALIGGLVTIIGTEIYLSLINKPVKGFKALQLLQAFLTAWTVGNPADLEHYFQISSEERLVSTEVLRIENMEGKQAPAPLLVVPGIHPGPFSPVGSSNLPGDIYQKLHTQNEIPLIFHSISDHELNLPSKEEVAKYAESLEHRQTIETGRAMSAPIVAKEGKATVSGFALGKTLLITLTLAPYGMEDLPGEIRKKVEERSSECGYDACLVIDTHNSLGDKPNEIETENLIKASTRVLQLLSAADQSTFSFGFAHSSEISPEQRFPDIGPAGVGLILFAVKDTRFCLAVADANNSRIGFRESVINLFQRHTSENLLEICTSDTHVTAAKAHNAKGYLALGDVTTPERFSSLLETLLEKAKTRLSPGAFETSKASSSVKTIGSQVLDNFSGLLDQSTLIARRGAEVLGILAVLITLAVAIL